VSPGVRIWSLNSYYTTRMIWRARHAIMHALSFFDGLSDSPCRPMLDQIDLDRAIGKREYKQQLDALQSRLYDLEQALFETRIPALIIFEGWASTGKIRMISLLTRRLDPRGLRVHPITPPRTYEQQYPWLYRFWLKT